MRRTLMLILGLCLLAGCFVVGNDVWDEGDFKPEIVQPETGKAIHGIPAQDQGDQLIVEAVETAVVKEEVAVWKVLNEWEDTDTPAAKEAGPAWGEASGLNWDQKYAAWVQSLKGMQSQTGQGQTFEFTTPWGKTLAAPVLEGAELAMFLRIAFASWYNLPFLIEAHHSKAGAFWVGHFGILNAEGVVPGTEDWFSVLADHTEDYSDKTPEELATEWPMDEDLRELDLSALDDDFQPAIEPDARLGAYLDEVFLNKRAGFFTGYVLTHFGSMHVAASHNSYNLAPNAVREGDVMLQRWSSSGIGHTLVVKTVTPLEGGKLDAESVYGSLPRIQPSHLSALESKVWFTSDTTGGLGVNDDGEALAATGAGLRRWRIAKRSDDRWVLTVAEDDQDAFIASTDLKSIATRPGQFQDLLGEPTPEQQRHDLLVRIQVARYNLSENPASCANRQRREEAYEELYELNDQHFGIDRAQTDKETRTLADYVFAELEYDQSRTCCWTGSTPAMYDIIMEYAEKQVEEQANCSPPSIFMAVEGEYAEFEDYAIDTGRGDEWVDWSADESCPQAGNLSDVEADHTGTSYCDWDSGEDPPDPEPDLPETCEDVDWSGQCDGNTVVWCEDDEPHFYECPPGTECGLLDGFDYYWCS